MKIYVCSLCLVFSPVLMWAQINAYAKVTSVTGTTLSLSNVNQTYHTFTSGEQVVVMQMQDTVIGTNTSNNPSFGSIATIANAGTYEVATISSVAGMPTSLTISAALHNNYNTGASVQIISFNLLGVSGYTTSSNITGVAWDGSVGGVVAFQVKGKLTLANSVSADGIGFRGGAKNPVNYEVTCEPGVYDTTSTHYASKGEGIDYIAFGLHTSRAPLANGGGGGSDDNAGGGGGGNFTSGGLGGQGWSCTPANASGGFGGVALSSYSSGFRVFMGGGGGGGQQNNSRATSGTAGGGIVLIKADTLTTACSGSITISASGVSTPPTPGNDGAGGGGGGGTIVMQVQSFGVPAACPLTISGNGGNGGAVNDGTSHGGGGGGGQGSVVFAVAIPTVNVTSQTQNGTGGKNSNLAGASSAGNGGGASNSGVVLATTVLPVRLVSFSAVKNGNSVLLAWSAASEQPARYFVQRAQEGSGFMTVAEVAGGKDSIDNYSYIDSDPLDGIVYYRIEAIDAAGAIYYSAVATVRMQGVGETFTIFPNPSDGRFAIRMNAGRDAYYKLTIANLTGERVFAEVYKQSGGLVEVTTGKRLPMGIYVVTVERDGNRMTGKLVVK